MKKMLENVGESKKDDSYNSNEEHVSFSLEIIEITRWKGYLKKVFEYVQRKNLKVKAESRTAIIYDKII
jgi:hypothetical protein